jgi:hypothetical protein
MGHEPKVVFTRFTGQSAWVLVAPRRHPELPEMGCTAPAAHALTFEGRGLLMLMLVDFVS